MMRAILFAIVLSLSPGAVLSQSTEFDAAMSGLTDIMQAGGAPDEIYRHLTQTIRASRAVGKADPDFAIFYAMLADHLRNAESNPVYALQVADEGLELIAGNPEQADFETVLKVSRSYALADLGRLQEAYEQAQMILPAYAAAFDQELAQSYAADAAHWGQGALSEFNTAATDIARKIVDDAYAFLDDQAYGRVLSSVASARLPMGTGLPEGDVRAINTEAEMLTARALAELGRHRDAANAWLRALGYMTATPWDMQGEIAWWGTGVAQGPHRGVAFTILQGLATSAGTLGIASVERTALARAQPLAGNARDLYSLQIRQARLALADKDTVATLALLEQAADTAQDAGNTLDLRVAEFYLAIVRAQGIEKETGSIPAENIIRATEAAVDQYNIALVSGQDFVLESAAQALVRSKAIDVALGYARRAVDLRRADLAQRRDSGFGREQARRTARSTVELFLLAAHTSASLGHDSALRAPDCDDPRGFMGCTVLRD